MIEMIRFDGTHIASQFKMNLLVASGVDANGKTLPLAWALVPIENGSWQRWFLKHLEKAFKLTATPTFVFMSDREKGIPSAKEEIFPKASLNYCC
jgi:transposase-like protein